MIIIFLTSYDELQVSLQIFLKIKCSVKLGINLDNVRKGVEDEWKKPFPKVSPWNSMEDKRKALRELKITKTPPNKHHPAPKVGFKSWFLKSVWYISLRLVSTEVSRTITGVLGPSDHACTKVSKRTD
jgi:hypothetical protein